MSKWISVDEEMPKQYQMVLVAFSYELPFKYRMPMHKGKRKMKVSTGYTDKHNMFRLNEKGGFYNNITVSHWMPYPEPPEVQ